MTAEAKTSELASQPMHADLESVLISEETLQSRIAALGEELARDYQGRDLVLVGILKGGMTFLCDLSRAIKIHHEYDVVGAQSYKGGTKPTQDVAITKDLDIEVEGRDVLLIEDIYDTGNTLEAIHRMIRLYRPRSLEICALLYKKKAHNHEMPIKYVGFEIEDVFVVGYGLDYRERYRNLPCVGVLHPGIYS